MFSIENHIGRINVSDKYLTELVKHTVEGCFGVAGICTVSPAQRTVSAVTGGKLPISGSGVHIHSSKDGGLIIDLHLRVTYGTNIVAAAKSITHKVVFTVEETIGVPVSEINVFADAMNY